MKKITLIWCLLLGITADTSYSQWVMQTNPLNVLLGKVHFVNASNGWITVDDGRLLKTTDGGTNWTAIDPSGATVTTALGDPAFAMSWVGTTHGWYINGYGTWQNLTGAVLYRTTDGGNNWISTDIETGTGIIGVQVQFLNETVGWATTMNFNNNNVKMYKTTDGGANWILLHTSTTVGGIFQFIDSNTGWMNTAGPNISAKKIYKTTDGGVNWVEQYNDPTPGELYSLHMLDANHGYVFGSGKIFKTTNGGVTWNSLANLSNANYKYGFFLNYNVGWVTENRISGNAFIMYTTNGGTSWTSQALPSNNGDDAFSIHFLDINNGWCITDGWENEIDNGKIYKTTTGGSTLSLSENKIDGFKLFPSIVKENLNLNANDRISKLEIYNHLGQHVFSLKIDDYTKSVNVSHLKSGMYYLKVQVEDKTGVYKFIKE